MLLSRVLLLALLVATCADAYQRKSGEPFAFHDFMGGVWDAWRLDLNCQEGDCAASHVRFNFTSRPGGGLVGEESVVLGEVVEAETEWEVAPSSPSAGTINTGSLDNFEKLTELLSYDFVPVSTKHWVSHGDLEDSQGGTAYTLHVVEPNEFVLTVLSSEGRALSTTAATRLKVKAPQGFLKRWGSFILIALLFAVQVILKGYCKGRLSVPPHLRGVTEESLRAREQAAGSQPAPASAATKKKQ